MNREKWRELCKNTPKGNGGTPRMFHQSTHVKYVRLPDGREVWVKEPGTTYRKG